MPLPAMSSSGAPLPATSTWVRTPLAITKGIVILSWAARSCGENAVDRAEGDPELRTHRRYRLIAILLDANDGATRIEHHRMMNFRAEIRRAHEPALHQVESLDRLVHGQDAQPLGSHAKLRGRVISRCAGGHHEAALGGHELAQFRRHRRSELPFEPV